MTPLAPIRAGRRCGMRSFAIDLALARAWKEVPVDS